MPTPIDNSTFAPTDATPTHTLHAEHHQELARSSAAIFPVVNFDTPQAAVNAAAAVGGGVVRFPLGTTTLTSTLLVPSFVTLEGPSPPYRAVEYGIDPSALGAKITGPVVTTFDLIQNADTVNGNSGITIRNLWIGIGPNTTASDVASVVFNKVRRSTIKDCYIRGAATASRYGLRNIGSSEHNWVQNSQFEGCGIKSEGSNTLRVIGCEMSQGGIILSTGFNHIIRDCDLYEDGVGAGVAYPGYPNLILATDCTEAVIVNNNLIAARQHGIYLAFGDAACLVQGNQVINSSQQTSGIWYGIVLESITAAHPTIDNIVTGNRCYNRGGITTQKYGIGVGSSSGTQTNNNLIVHNTVNGNATGGIDPFTAGLTNTYRDNRGFITEAFGTTSVTNGATVTHGLAATPTTVVATARTAKHIVTVTARSSTTFTVGLHDDTGTAIAVGENVDWHAVYTPA